MPIGNIKISAAVITYNEEKNLADCLQSLRWCDEIVVVDSLSEDRTCEIAREFGAKIIDQKFLGHVKQKQLALEACENNWVISLDADERVSEELKNSIFQLFEKTKEENLLNAYTVSRRSYHLGRWIMHGSWYPDRNIRVVNRNHVRWGGIDPHDRLETTSGETGNLTGDLDHYVFRDLTHNVQQNNLFSGISASILYNEGKKPSFLKLLFKPFGKFLETYIIKRGFLDGLPGFIIAVGAGYSMFLKYAKLWEKHLPDRQIENKK
ncbi:MAG: glycosyltransferase involved in cell wall biosynthesis [bacterium]|jgi:glycosyltransferase involved in cell wall biosynthesis